MLSKDLLIVIKRNGVIRPKYLRDLNIAKSLIAIFNEHVGNKYKDLQQDLNAFEEGNKDYKVIRGLSTLLERDCEFETNSTLDSVKIRSFLFERGLIIDDFERNQIIEQACDFFKGSKEEIEEAFFSDLPEGKILIKLPPISALDLIKRYNLSLTQTLLFNALELTISIEGNYQQIFRQINYLGLMYEVEKNDSEIYFIKITGPASLLRITKKYGTSFAYLFNYIIKADKWSLSAKIEMKSGNEPRIYDFKLNSEDSVLLYKNMVENDIFDSEVEAQFYKDFKLYNMGWEIKREPTIIRTKNYITVPDFGFYKHGRELFLEVVGFWTPEYVKKKIWKLKNAETKIMVAVNQNLNCEKGDFPSEVIFYKDRIPVKPIIKILKKIDEKYIKLEIEKLKTVKITEDFVSIKEKAKELNASIESLKKLELNNHYIIGDMIVSQNYLQKVKEKIGTKRNYSKVSQIIADNNLTLGALEYMGYKIEWKGLIPVKITNFKK